MIEAYRKLKSIRSNLMEHSTPGNDGAVTVALG